MEEEEEEEEEEDEAEGEEEEEEEEEGEVKMAGSGKEHGRRARGEASDESRERNLSSSHHPLRHQLC